MRSVPLVAALACLIGHSAHAANPGTLETISTVRGFVNSNGETVEADLVTSHRDKVYIIRGIVTVSKGVMNVNSASSDAMIYVQDETGGIAVYDENNQAFPPQINEGDYVEIKGRVGYFKGNAEIHPQTNPGINVNADPGDDKTGKANMKILGTASAPPVGVFTKLGKPITDLAAILAEPPSVVACADLGKDNAGLWSHQRTNPETPNNRAEQLDGSLVRLTGVRFVGVISSIVEDDVGTTPTIAPPPGGVIPDSWAPPYSRVAVQDQTGTAFLFISQRTDIIRLVYSSTGGVVGYDNIPFPPSSLTTDVVGIAWQRYSPVAIATKYLAYYTIAPRYIGRVSGVVTQTGRGPVADALVEVLRGGAVVASTRTFSDGRYEGVLTGFSGDPISVKVTTSEQSLTSGSRALGLGTRWVNDMLLPFVDTGQANVLVTVTVPGVGVVTVDVPRNDARVILERRQDVPEGLVKAGANQAIVLAVGNVKPGPFSLRVFNRLGELVYEKSEEKTVLSSWVWIPEDLGSGVHFLRLEGPEVGTLKKVIIAR